MLNIRKRMASLREESIDLLLLSSAEDNDPSSLKSILQTIKKFKVKVVRTIDSALLRVKGGGFDVFICDSSINTCKDDGLIKNMTEAQIDIPLIFVTSLEHKADAVKALNAGAEDYCFVHHILEDQNILIKSVISAVEKQRIRKTLIEDEELSSVLMQSMHEGVIILKETSLVFFNLVFCAIMESLPDLTIDTDFISLFDTKHRKAFLKLIESARESGEVREGEFILKGSPLKPKVYANIKLIACRYRGEPALLGTVKDITTRIVADRMVQELLDEQEKKSIMDDLTTLFNRLYAMQTLEAEIVRSQRYKSPLSLIIMDLYQLKRINDTFGHMFGDEALVVAAAILKDELREIDIVARYGGDEFILILPQTELKQARSLASRVIKKVAARKLKVVPEGEVNLALSVGISTLRMEDDNLTELIKRCDDALCEAKEMGSDQVVVKE